MTKGRTARTAVLALVAVLLSAAAATAAQRTSPDMGQTTLQPGDLPGAVLASHGAGKPKGYVSAYQRTYQLKTPQGSAGIVYIQSAGQLAGTIAKAKTDVQLVETSLRTKVGKKLFIAGIAATVNVKPKAVSVSAVRKPKFGDNAFEQPVSVLLKGHRVYEDLLYLQLDRVVATLVLAGIHPVTSSAAAKYATVVMSHITTALTPVSTAAPTVTGTAVQGQTLTAAPGTWSNDDVAFTYQWQHCDATGANCVDVTGATATTYAVTATDVGFTLRVVATATNRFGAPTAPSVVTAAVA
ncbi:MAG TPA: hypothetical protein VF379_03325 [Gaiellaceae bacterium]